MILKFTKDIEDCKAGRLYDIPQSKRTHALINLGIAFEPEDAQKQYREQQEADKPKNPATTEDKKLMKQLKKNYAKTGSAEESFGKQQIKIIPLKRFRKKTLLLDIHCELSTDIKKDDPVKMLTFLICATSRLKQPDRRKSNAIKGDSSVGKDHLIKCCIKHFPDNIFLTAATKSVIEDNMKEYRIVAYSELNLSREDHGANALIVEQIKQMAEGGISSMKKDVSTGFKVAKHEKDEQKTVLYGTTESEDDEELKPRFIVSSVTADKDKISAVHKLTLDSFAGLTINKSESWILQGIEKLQYDDVIIPSELVSDLEGKPIFDSSDPRAMRDTKRFMSLVAAVAYLHQLQRKIVNKRIIAEPFDVLATMIIASNFFNHTYSGLGDQRLQECMDVINSYCDEKGIDVFPRLEIEKCMGRSKNAVKGYLKGISNLSIVGWSHNEGNAIYYQRYQKGIKKVLIDVNWLQFKDILFKKQGVKIPPERLGILTKLDKIVNSTPKSSVSQKIDTLKLTPSKKIDTLESPIIQVEEVKDNQIHLKCSLCGETPSHSWHSGKPICKECKGNLEAQK